MNPVQLGLGPGFVQIPRRPGRAHDIVAALHNRRCKNVSQPFSQSISQTVSQARLVDLPTPRRVALLTGYMANLIDILLPQQLPILQPRVVLGIMRLGPRMRQQIRGVFQRL
jgi:hypothetical protein